MKLFNPFKISYKNLLAAKFRSFLTILGIIIGVGSVVVIMAIGQSAQEMIVDQIRGVGSNLIGVLPGASDEKSPPPTALGITITTLKYEDLLALRNDSNVPEVEDGAGYVLGSATVERNGISSNISFTGTTASFIKVENAEIESGRFFSSNEESNLSRVAVLGPKAKENIFGSDNAIGEKIRIKNQSFTVIGIMKSRGSEAFSGGDQDNSVIVPLKTAEDLLLGINHLAFIRLKVKTPELVSLAIANTKATLRERHGIKDPTNDDFSVRDQRAALDLIGKITDVLRYFLLAIGSVSLIVGGVGIMNVMLISVNQRIKEVGLRKAVGARNSEVITQFLIEAAFISSLGGIIGIIGGVISSFFVSVIMQKLGYNWPFLVSVQSIIIAFSVSALIGMVFGLYPARKASKISPMEALRYE